MNGPRRHSGSLPTRRQSIVIPFFENLFKCNLRSSDDVSVTSNGSTKILTACVLLASLDLLAAKEVKDIRGTIQARVPSIPLTHVCSGKRLNYYTMAYFGPIVWGQQRRSRFYPPLLSSSEGGTYESEVPPPSAISCCACYFLLAAPTPISNPFASVLLSSCFVFEYSA